MMDIDFLDEQSHRKLGGTHAVKLQKRSVQAIERFAKIVVNDADAMTAMNLYDRQFAALDQETTVILKDPALANRGRQEVNNDLWELISYLSQHREMYSNADTLQKKLSEFIKELLRPFDEYEVAIRIENISLPDGELTIGGVLFTHFDEARAADWEIRINESLAGDIVGQAVGIVRVTAGSSDKAWEMAGSQIDTALALIRATLANLRGIWLHDDQLLLQRGEIFTIRRLTSPRTVTGGARRGFRPSPLNLRDQPEGLAHPMFKAVQDTAQRVSSLFDDATPRKLRDSLLRAAEWIGSSITRPNFDDKIVDLCTAMECMLATKSDGRKGEAIALRYMILTSHLTSGYIYPHAVLPIYELRSDVIHGSRRHAASQQDYLLLREIAWRTLSMVIELIETRSDLKSISDVTIYLDGDEQQIERTLAVLLDPKYPPDMKVLEYAHDKLG